VNDARREVVRRGYDEIADRYLAARATGGDLALLPELVALLSDGDAVLDAGCGAGVPVMTQLVAADLEVVGIDLSSAQVRLARSHTPGARSRKLTSWRCRSVTAASTASCPTTP
jgi:2-polyprenyl-3-methyl-5-hydroxy-6-metoxy-1,4-benzoquinol methylase